MYPVAGILKVEGPLPAHSDAYTVLMQSLLISAVLIVCHSVVLNMLQQL